MVKTLDSNKARAQWRTLLDETAAGRTSYVITRYGQPHAVLMPYEEFRRMTSNASSRRQKRSTRRKPKAISAFDHPTFGMTRDDPRTVEQIMDELRGGRYHDL